MKYWLYSREHFFITQFYYCLDILIFFDHFHFFKNRNFISSMGQKNSKENLKEDVSLRADNELITFCFAGCESGDALDDELVLFIRRQYE